MKVLAQCGFGPKDKLTRGIGEGILDGVILSPRYCKPEKLKSTLGELQETGAFLAMDPEFYATNYLSHPTPKLGALEEWDYFVRPRRSSMISGAALPQVLRSSLQVQTDLGLKHLIAPNLFIRQADSIDTAVALNFLDQTKLISAEISDSPVYGTLAIHRDALLAGENFRDILDGLTGIENPPDGYYIIVGSSEQQSSGTYIRSDLSHPDVIAAWMYANYVLSLNGSNVINGYCFLLSPLLAICGATGAASGWSSGLRKFCIERYVRTKGGGRNPNTRYVSNPLMSHIKQTDLDAYRSLGARPLNGLGFDQVYENAEPSRTEEALQAWEAIRSAANKFCNPGGIANGLAAFKEHIEEARLRLTSIQAAGLTNEIEPNLERLQAMDEGIDLFMQWAELS